MISSIRNFLLKNGSGVSNGSENRKRKRTTRDCLQDEDDEVVVTAVKRPKFTSSQPSGTSIYEKLFSSPYKKMADWVKSKTGSWSTMYTSKSQNRPHEFPISSRNINEGCLNGGLRRQIVLPNRQQISNHSQKNSFVNKMNGNGRILTDQKAGPSVCSNSSQTDNSIHSNLASNSSQTDDVIYNGTTFTNDHSRYSRGSQTVGSRRHGIFTAQSCVLLEEKEQYKALLQQFTSVPLVNSLSQPKVSTIMSQHYSALNTTKSSEITRTKFLSRHVPAMNVMKNSDIGKIHIPKTLQSNSYDPVLKEKVSVTQPAAIPKSISEDVVIVEEDTKETQRKPVPNYQKPECLEEDWMDDLVSRYSNKVRDRQRKIKEVETESKIYDERRKAEEDRLEKRILNRMKLLSTDLEVDDELIPDLESEDEEEHFPELTDKMMQEISMALRPNPPDEVLSEGFRIKIQRKDMITLGGLNWLNDEVINFYMNLLMERGEKEGYPNIHAFNTFFYPKLQTAGYSGVRRWTKKIDIFSKDLIVIPIHLSVHWCLAIVDMKKKLVQYYDSMGGHDHQCLNAIRQYLQDESLDKRSQPLDLSEWSTETVTDIPHQMNGSDCGMFACKFAEYITRGAKITFTQDHMPYFRKRMVYEILKKSLLQ